MIESSILLSQIKTLVQFRGLELHAETVIVSCPICSIITPGKYKAACDIFRYVLAYSFNLTNLMNEIFFCGTVRNMYKLNRCLSLSVASICISACICMHFECMYCCLFILDTSEFDYKISFVVWSNEST